MSTLEGLALVTQLFSDATGVAISTLSSRIFNDGKRLAKVVDGTTDVGLKKYDEALQYFSDNWPDGTEWPLDVARPAPAPKEQATA